MLRGMRAISFDRGATTPVDPRVLEAVLPFLAERCGDPSARHPRGRGALRAGGAARAGVATLVGAWAVDHFLEVSPPIVGESRRPRPRVS